MENHIYCLRKIINRRKRTHRKINWPSLISLAIHRISFFLCCDVYAVMYYKKMYPGGSRVLNWWKLFNLNLYKETIFPILMLYDVFFVRSRCLEGWSLCGENDFSNGIWLIFQIIFYHLSTGNKQQQQQQQKKTRTKITISIFKCILPRIWIRCMVENGEK